MTLIVGLRVNAAGAAEQVTEQDKFELWNECGPVNLEVALQSKDKVSGLTEDKIRIAAESRLRAARIYDPERLVPYLVVNVHVIERAFSIDIHLSDIVSKLVRIDDHHVGLAITWMSGSTGRHSGDGGFILQGISEHLDLFINEYLRVNAEAC